MRTKRGATETRRWRASEPYSVSRSTKRLQTAWAKSMMRQRSESRLSRAVTGAGRDWPDKPPSVYQRSVAHKLTFQSVASQTSRRSRHALRTGMPSTAARSCCVDGNKRSHARPMPFRDPGVLCPILDEQLPAGRDVTSVDGAPAPDSAAPEPIGPKVRSYLLRPQPELPAAGIPSRETAERANVNRDHDASKLPCDTSNITVVPSGVWRS